MTVGRHPKPPKTTGGAQDQGSGRRSSPVGQRTAPASCFLRVVHTKVQGQSFAQGEPKRPDGCEPEEAWCHPGGSSDGARISHTLRQDRVQGEEGKRRDQTVETRAVTC